MKPQTITTPTGDRLVVIPETDYATLLALADDATDAAALASFRRELAAGREELVPSAIVARMLDGDNRIRVWREHRGLTPEALASKAGMTLQALSEIEAGREGNIEALRRLAAAMDLTLDDLAG